MRTFPATQVVFPVLLLAVLSCSGDGSSPANTGNAGGTHAVLVGSLHQVRAGETVLIWGVGGGVGSAALAVAKLLGARVFVTSSSDAKLARARELGADVTLNHQQLDVAREIRTLTDKRGVDVVVDSVGAGTWEQSLRVLGRGGRLVTCGATTGPQVEVEVRRLFWYQGNILGSTMGSAEEYREIVRLLGQGQLRPLIDSVTPFADVLRAFERLAAGDQMGKVVVQIG